ncbi:MAG: hypothetical protein GAK32_02618 [Pseudomonas fluorescens]|nr:MAG: hypothetical protein GAK32_02618 [Pseudomonas fluorescens]
MLDRQNLTAIAQRALGQQADFREAVDDDTGRFETLHDLENLPGGLAKLQIGGVQQALLLFGIQQAFRWGQFEDVDVFTQCPTMGFGSLAQLALGLRQGDVQATLPSLGARLQKMQGHSGFAGAWLSFEQEQVAT